MIKTIHFPSEEIKKLQYQNKIITTRVSKEYGRYQVNEIVQTPWLENYTVYSIQKINNVKQHPFYSFLTEQQIQLLSKYKRIEILTLEKIKRT